MSYNCLHSQASDATHNFQIQTKYFFFQTGAEAYDLEMLYVNWFIITFRLKE